MRTGAEYSLLIERRKKCEYFSALKILPRYKNIFIAIDGDLYPRYNEIFIAMKKTSLCGSVCKALPFFMDILKNTEANKKAFITSVR